MSSFRGFDKRVIATADLKPGDLIYGIDAGMLVQLVAVRHRDGGITEINYNHNGVNGIRRRATVRRKTAGRSTIHVRTDSQETR